MPAIRIRSGRHPFEVTLLAATLACGIALLVADARPRSITTAMPLVVQSVWEWGLILVGVVGLLGVAWRGHPVTGLGIELGAMLVLGTTTAMYAIALFAVSGTVALAAGSFIAAIAVASWWRAGQIMCDLRGLARTGQRTDPVQPAPLTERDQP